MSTQERAELLLKKEQLEIEKTKILEKLKIASSVFHRLANKLSNNPQDITLTHVQKPFNGFPISLMDKESYDWHDIEEIPRLIYELRELNNSLINVNVSLDI